MAPSKILRLAVQFLFSINFSISNLVKREDQLLTGLQGPDRPPVQARPFHQIKIRYVKIYKFLSFSKGGRFVQVFWTLNPEFALEKAEFVK